MITKPPSEAAKRMIHKRAPDGVRRAARAAACRHCGGSVMRGLDDDRAAAAVAVEVYPLSPAGELAALLSGRTTYALTWYQGRGCYEIDVRQPENIEHSPAGTVINRDVVVGHVCESPRFERLNTNHAHRSSQALPIEAPF